ncbi:hypothetical protein NPIL_305611 [Nephila pilipes]|uniref:Uncharacterized protein n=1 Tax=Nephila pilipes TaxID=299642 RepID=A0A8X6TFP5_NEPPI|nr:hypothetical protein NPIL_305611 [Nephila pilipes]
MSAPETESMHGVAEDETTTVDDMMMDERERNLPSIHKLSVTISKSLLDSRKVLKPEMIFCDSSKHPRSALQHYT